jgi:hypothetical protein
MFEHLFKRRSLTRLLLWIKFYILLYSQFQYRYNLQE